LTTVDSGIPLGPGLLVTWVPVPGPHMKTANAKINKATIAINVRPPMLLSRSFFGMQLSFISCFGIRNASKLKHKFAHRSAAATVAPARAFEFARVAELSRKSLGKHPNVGRDLGGVHSSA
jgi:hypothetical protein